MIKAITRGLRQAGMPFDCSRIMPWQNRKTRPSAAAAASASGLSNHSAASAAGNSTPATQASRDIQERCGWRSTYMKRNGRPILNISRPRPQAMMTSAASTGSSGGIPAKLANAATPSKPAPAPPQRKLPAAFQSQCF